MAQLDWGIYFSEVLNVYLCVLSGYFCWFFLYFNEFGFWGCGLFNYIFRDFFFFNVTSFYAGVLYVYGKLNLSVLDNYYII